jgi:DNA topoisomerase I
LIQLTASKQRDHIENRNNVNTSLDYMSETLIEFSEQYSGLIRSSDDVPGYCRKRRGRGFLIFDESRNKITEKAVIERIQKLGIPPIWKEVWICSDPRGHLQATGLDTRGRKQYLYHDDWIRVQQETKFEKLLTFGHALPEIRKKINADLNQKEWNRERVLALIIGILDETYIRIGNRHYLEMNKTHGLTTLRRKHLKIGSREAILKYNGKHNIEHIVRISNRKFIRLVKECSELPGHEIFRYKNDIGKTVAATSHDVNEYLQEITGERFTSKNFRTWGGTVTAIKRFPYAKKRVEENPRLKLRKAVVKEVAEVLNNTIAICEKYYIHPKVLDALDNINFSPRRYKLRNKPDALDWEEKLALAIID